MSERTEMSDTVEAIPPTSSGQPGGQEGGREAGQAEQIVVRHDRLNRDGPMEEDDLIIVEGRDGGERTMMRPRGG